MTNHPITPPAAAMPAEPPAPDDGVCDRCGEPSEECVCWEDEELWHPRLVETFAQHDPPLELAQLNTLAEFGHTRCLIEVIDEWLHFELGPVGVLTPRPEQYADLPVERIPLGVTQRWAIRYPLVVADDADLLRFASVLALCRGGHQLVVVAGWGSHVSMLAGGDAPELDRVLLVNYHSGRAFPHFPGGVPVLLDPITRGDVDPVRRRTHLNGVLIEDSDLSDSDREDSDLADGDELPSPPTARLLAWRAAP